MYLPAREICTRESAKNTLIDALMMPVSPRLCQDNNPNKRISAKRRVITTIHGAWCMAMEEMYIQTTLAVNSVNWLDTPTPKSSKFLITFSWIM